MALNVTIYGLGIVFLALLVLMVAIMLLTKAFSMATGKELLAVRPAPAPATQAADAPAPVEAAAAAAAAAEPAGTGEPVTAPLPGKILSVAVKAGDRVKTGDELCVIEALKMANSIKSPRDGTVQEVSVAVGESVAFGAPLVVLASAAGRPAARPAPAPAAARRDAAPVAGSFLVIVGGAQHAVDIRPDAVVLDGATYEVRRDSADPARVLVNGQAHTVEVKERTASSVVVVVDGVSQRVDLAPRTAPAPVSFTLAAEGASHRVEVRDSNNGGGSVSLDGTTYQVQRDRNLRSKLLVNGKPHTVEVKERTPGGARVWIDGLLQDVAIAAETAPAAAAAPAAPAPAAAAPRPAATGGEPVTAPLPGKILSVGVKAGDRVKAGDELCVIEALKMANSIKAQRDGTVREVVVSPGQSVAFGAPLLILG
jgi:glutaconyl-CoA decarboxylase